MIRVRILPPLGEAGDDIGPSHLSYKGSLGWLFYFFGRRALNFSSLALPAGLSANGTVEWREGRAVVFASSTQNGHLDALVSDDSYAPRKTRWQ